MLVEEYLQVCVVFVVSYALIVALAVYVQQQLGIPEEPEPLPIPNANATAAFMRLRISRPSHPPRWGV